MSNTVDLKECFEVIQRLVKDAGEIIVHRNESRRTFVCKAGDIDLVTETDKEVEELLINGLKSVFPTHKFIGEETSGTSPNVLTDDPTWIIDPIDGTMNFVHGFPHSCVSVGLVVNKVTEIGIIFNPLLQQMFYAQRGKGAFCNDKKLQVSTTTSLKTALITSEFGTTRDAAKMKIVHENFMKLSSEAHAIRCLGSAALNMVMVALGAADCNFEFGIHAWDVCAGDLIVREAGGIVIDPAGGPFDMMSRRVLAASSPELAEEVTKVLTQFYPEPRDD